MCDWGETVILSVVMHPDNSHTGKLRRARKGVDKCIAPIVKALNDAKIYTRASCCGHGKQDGSIILHDGRELIIKGAK